MKELVENGEQNYKMQERNYSDITPATMEKVLIDQDLSNLTPAQRIEYVLGVCKSLNLNPATKPFGYLLLDGKLRLYALKDCTEQLRKINGVSIIELSKVIEGDLLIYTAKAQDRTGRYDIDIGAVMIGTNKGLALANLMMKGATKAKRRVTLSICGLGLPDESELDTLPGAKTFEYDKPLPEQNTAQQALETPQNAPEGKQPQNTAEAPTQATEPAPESKTHKPEALVNHVIKTMRIIADWGFNKTEFDTIILKYSGKPELTQASAKNFNEEVAGGFITKEIVTDILKTPEGKNFEKAK